MRFYFLDEIMEPGIFHSVIIFHYLARCFYKISGNSLWCRANQENSWYQIWRAYHEDGWIHHWSKKGKNMNDVPDVCGDPRGYIAFLTRWIWEKNVSGKRRYTTMSMINGECFFSFVWDLIVQLSLHEVHHGPGKMRYKRWQGELHFLV